ncbi:hypothetical protein SAMN05428975_3285 [Mucilaginibacter sp. OK268]|nr:hypothetical protein SAMN05428975_3285 [Mucilaginibacter sp. OK268]
MAFHSHASLRGTKQSLTVQSGSAYWGLPRCARNDAQGGKTHHSKLLTVRKEPAE